MQRLIAGFSFFLVPLVGGLSADHLTSHGHSDTTTAAWGDATLDGWSFTGVFTAPLDSGNPAETIGSVVDQPVLYYAQPREDVETYRIFPLLAVNEAGDYELIAHGSGHEPVVAGLNSYVPTWTGTTEFQTDAVPGITYHIGFGMTRIGIENNSGGIIPFNDNGGEGIIVRDDNTSDPDWVPALGPWVDGHASGPGGRDYQYIQAIQWSSVDQPIDCDFNGDGMCTTDDVDLLVAEIVAGTNDTGFDLTGDGSVGQDDLDIWLSSAATENGKGAPYLPGDANLDGTVDAADLNQVGINWQGSPNMWSSGDFDASGRVDAGDLNLLGINWQQMIPMLAPANSVPEPATLCLAGLGLGWLFHIRRRKRAS